MIENTTIFALVTTTAAIFAPIFTKCIEARTQVKLKKIDLVYSNKKAVYQAFSKSYVHFMYKSHRDGDEYLKYVTDFQDAYLICKKNTRAALKVLSTTINSIRAFPEMYDELSGKAYDAFDNVSISMANELSNY